MNEWRRSALHSSRQPAKTVPVGRSYAIWRSYFKWLMVWLMSALVLGLMVVAPFLWRQQHARPTAGAKTTQVLGSVAPLHSPIAFTSAAAAPGVVKSAPAPLAPAPKPMAASPMAVVKAAPLAPAIAPMPAALTAVAASPKLQPAQLAAHQSALSITQVQDDPWNEVRDQYNQAVLLLSRGALSAATNLLWEIIQSAPDYMPARVALIQLLIDTPRHNVAAALINNGLLQSADNVVLLSLKARLLMHERHPQQALALLEAHSPNIYNNPDYYALMAYLDATLNRPNMAAALYQQLLTVDRNNAAWWLGLGVCLRRLHKDNQAITAFRQALQTMTSESDPNSRAYARVQLQALEAG